MASTRFEAIADDFSFLDEWEDRYRFLIELGRKMPSLADAQKAANFKVDGCASQVWIVPQISGSGPTARFTFSGDSDALIVKGLIALLHSLYNGLTSKEVLEIDAIAELARLGLDQHLSSQRSNGLRAMIVRIRSIASTLTQAQGIQQ